MAAIRKRPLLKRDGTPSGNVAWLLDFKDHLGRRRVRQFATWKEADGFKDYALAMRRNRSYVHHTESPSVSDAVVLWAEYLASRVDAGARMEPATRDDYLAKLKLHFVPLVGNVPVSQITPAMIRDLCEELRTTGRSPATVRKVLATLVQFFRHLQEHDLCSTNPAHGVRLESSTRNRQLRIPSRAQMATLLENATDAIRPLLVVSCFCGLRSSELRGLQWKDVDFDKRFLWIRQRVDQRGKTGSPKTRSGTRKVPFGATVAAALSAVRLRKCFTEDGDWVFTSELGTPLMHSNVLHRHWYPLREKVGLTAVRWHDLRHFAISLWIAQGLPTATVKEYAGHSSISTTVDIYGHLIPEDHPGALLDRMELSVVG